MQLYKNDTYATSHDYCDKVFSDPTHLYNHLADSKEAHFMVVCYLKRVYGNGNKCNMYSYTTIE